MNKAVGKVLDIDRGYKAIRLELVRAQHSRVKIGVQAGTRRRPTEDEKNPPSMAEVAAANEFGTDHIPERSFMRSTFDENRGKIAFLMRSERDKIIGLRRDVKTSLGLLGLWFEGEVKKKISSNVSPANAPATIARKTKRGKGGKVTTLINYGQLRASIRYKVILRSSRVKVK